VLSGAADRRSAVAALEAGADDQLRKPCDPSELAARVRKAAEAQRLVADLDRRSSTDPLTGLPNRRGMEAVLAALGGPAGSVLACCWWTSTGSRPSTTPTATTPATSCCGRWPAASPPPRPRSPSPGGAARSSSPPAAAAAGAAPGEAGPVGPTR